MYSTANLTDKELKEQGNRLFSIRKYEEAINCYSKAIVSEIHAFRTAGKH
jgi:STIP1 family protein 1